MQKFFDKQRNRLVYIDRQATAAFWDQQWMSFDIRQSIESGRRESFVFPTTAKFLNPYSGSKILEGGCGRGNFVYSLASRGYDAYGIDFAKATVEHINKVSPELKVSVADVRRIPFPKDHFDGYWSLGVIEHFYGGFDDIAQEMKRVIKSGGFLFLTFPYLSPLRRVKASLGAYSEFEGNLVGEPSGFYQFALNHKSVIQDFLQLGFTVETMRPLDGLNGLKNESFSFLGQILGHLYQNKSLLGRGINYILSRMLAPISGHSILLVLKKT